MKRLSKHYIISIALLTFLIEAITCLFRFGFQMASTKDTKFLAKVTFGLRIHHGYIGIIIILCTFFFMKKTNRCYVLLIIIGYSLFFSDVIHHFCVLWPITGSPHFDLVYPE